MYETSISIGEGGFAPIVFENYIHDHVLTFHAQRELKIFIGISLNVYGSDGLKFNGVYVVNLTWKFFTIQSCTFSQFPATAEADVIINTYLTIVTIDETTDTDYSTFNKLDTITVTGKNFQDVNVLIEKSFGITQFVGAELLDVTTIYVGLSAASGAVFVQFYNTSQQAVTAKVTFENSRHIDNSGTVSGCVVFRSNIILRKTFKRIDFFRNRYSVDVNLLKKASSIFTFEGLLAQLGDNPFITSCSPHRLSTLIRDYDLTYANLIPFCTSLERRTYVRFLKSIEDNLFIQQDYSHDEDDKKEYPFSQTLICITKLPVIVNRIKFLQNKYHVNSSIIIDNQRKEASPVVRNPTIFNLLNDQQTSSAAFFVHKAKLGISNFNIIQKDSNDLTTEDPVNYFISDSKDGFLLVTNINFDINNANVLIQRSCIYNNFFYNNIVKDESENNANCINISCKYITSTEIRENLLSSRDSYDMERRTGEHTEVSVEACPEQFKYKNKV
ncbi:MAG: hypothetical protein EZS28_015182 [Streblomastix strix]|uniref:Uncharacterized protein n=1 Tax=Streblomastix strix TaxID=222440 RepID=A0A5J4W3K6_9EUKA|nr:MAG: hypothetical protein EZS28_015182 [Streblomastix strix]